MLKVVIVGYGEMFTNLIAGALDANCKIVGVLRKETVKLNPFLRIIKDIINPSLEYNYIKSYNLPEIIAPDGVNSELFRKKILELNPDIILVGSWFEKFSKETFNLPKLATINAHPSLLPKYRGPNPYYWTIRNQEKVSGISFHLMDEKYDSGAILAQEEIEISPEETGKSLKQKTVLKARGVLRELLLSLNDDVIIPLTQIENKSSYYSHPEVIKLDFKKAAKELYSEIRACHNWVNSYFYHNISTFIPNPLKTSIENNPTKYTEAGTIIEIDYKTKTIAVLCGDGNVLKMTDINYYKICDRPFTKNYIKLDMKIGDILF